MIESILLTNKTTSASVLIDKTPQNDFVLDSVDFGKIEANHSTVKYYNQIGETQTNVTLGTRSFQLIGYVTGATTYAVESHKDFLNRFVNPLQDIQAQITRLDNTNYDITISPDSSIAYGTTTEENNEYFCKFSISGVCFQPLFELDQPRTELMAATLPHFRFPLHIKMSRLAKESASPISFGDANSIMATGVFEQLTQYGNSSQTKTQSGKNLLGLKSGTASANGVTCTIDADGTITLNGTASAGIYFEISPALKSGVTKNGIPVVSMTRGKAYKFTKYEISGTASEAISVELRDTTDINFPANFVLSSTSVTTVTAGTPCNTGWSSSLNIGVIDICVSSGIVFSNYKIRLQLEQNTQSTNWEQFVPNSPSPLYPATISGVTKTTISDGGSNSQVINLPQTLYGLPDGTADSYDEVSKTGSQKVKRLVLDGTQAFQYYVYSSSTGNVDFTLTISQLGVAGKTIQSEKFTTDASSSYGYMQCIVAGGNGIFFRAVPATIFGITASDTTAQAEAKISAWFAANPTAVFYPLATYSQITGSTPNISPYASNTQVTNDNGGLMACIIKNDSIITMVMGLKQTQVIKVITNDGAVPTGFTVHFKALGDGVVNPSLYDINLQKTLKINKTMLQGEQIDIDTTIGKKTITGTLGGVASDYFGYLDIDSDWLQLNVGDNIFRYNADAHIEKLEVSIEFSTKLLEVQ